MRKVLSIVVTIAMLFAMITTVSVSGFSDVAGQSYAEAVDYLFNKGIVNGRSENSYEPESNLTRAEMVTIILRAYGSKESSGKCTFTDVSDDHWAFEYIISAYEMGIINGMSETIFEPDTPVTYEQAVKMMVCAVGMETDAVEKGGYPDGYIEIAEEKEFLSGVEAEKGKPISRGAMAQLVYNCLMTDEDELDYLHNWDEYDEDFQWIAQERMRGMTVTENTLAGGEKSLAKKVVDSGVNTFYLNLLTSPYTIEADKAFIEKNLELMKSYDIHKFIKINFGDNVFIPNGKFGTYHSGTSSSMSRNTPDMLSEQYWEKMLLERVLAIAEYPEIEGVVLDFEMYSGGTSSYPSPCMCDNCWTKYHSNGDYDDDWESIPIEERNSYINEFGEYEDYRIWQVEEVEKLCANIRDKALEINPSIKFAYMPSFEWLPGITRGLGTETRPVIVLSEDEYWGSFSDTETRLRTIKDEDYPAVFLPGLYTSSSQALSPEKTSEKILECATGTAGYWIFSASQLVGEKPESLEKYLEEILYANSELNKLLEAGEILPFPTYEVRTYVANMIDGELPTEKDWNDAETTDMFLTLRDGSDNVPVKSQAKILYSENDIFVKYIGYDNMSSFNPGATVKRDGNLWGNNCVEVYWRFGDSTPAVQVAADAVGSFYDAFCSGIGTRDSGATFEGACANAELFDDRWEITFRIPGTMDGTRKIETGDVLRMEISRNTPGGATTCWAPTYGAYLGTKSIWGIVELD